jgi:Protein of unknown function (DUF2892)
MPGASRRRQLQIGAGTLILLGTRLGLTVSPRFPAVPPLVGSGLVFAGLTGYCGMALGLRQARPEPGDLPGSMIRSRCEGPCPPT